MNKDSIPFKKGNWYLFKNPEGFIETYANFARVRGAGDSTPFKKGPFLVLNTDMDLDPHYLQVEVLIGGCKRVFELNVFHRGEVTSLAKHFEAYIDE